MNINALKNRLVKKASMQKVAGPNAASLRKTLNTFKNIRVNPQLKSELINFRRDLERAYAKNLSESHLLEDVYTLSTPVSEFGLPDVYNTLNMAVSRANNPVKMRKFTDRIERFLTHPRSKILAKKYLGDI